MQLSVFVVIAASCLIYTTGCFGQETDGPTTNSPPNFENGRFFFGDPCNNPIYQFLNITDAKCSLQCYIQAGLQNGGFCENNACQCNQEALL